MQHPVNTTLPRTAASASGSPSVSPLAGLAGSDLSRRFRRWCGASGRRHLFSVFPIVEPCPGDEVPRFADAVVLAVGRDTSGTARILAMDETGPLPDLFYDSARFRAAVAAGADEIHVHLLAGGAAERSALMRDLADA